MPKGAKGQKPPAPARPPKPSKAGTMRVALPAPETDRARKGRTKRPSSATSLNTPAQSAKCTSRMRTARSARDANQLAQSHGFDWREWFVPPIGICPTINASALNFFYRRWNRDRLIAFPHHG